MTELKSRIDISEIIGEYVDLQQKGKNLMGLCPFHSERTPSFCVYPANGSFYCFGCGAGGDVITFLRLVEHYDYIEAVKNLAERAGMDFEVSEEDNAIHQKKLLIYKINRDAAKFYHSSLLKECGKEALSYLKKRNVSLKTLKHFGLGYSPSTGYALVDYLKKIGYNSEDIILSDLAFKTRNGKEIDRFRNRLMFPIIDVKGNVIAFGARTMGKDMPKYINTSDTPVFKKSSNLFSLNFAKKSGKNEFILTEGYMDVISLYQAGFDNAVAGLGTALTVNQVKLLARNVDNVVVSYDSDLPGQKAANKAIEMLKDNGLEVKVLSIPKAKDPDEFLQTYGKDGAVKFKNLIENSKNDIEYKLSNVKSSYDLSSPNDKVKYITAACEVLAKCRNSVEREIYAIKISEEANISKDSVMLQINKIIKKNRKKSEKIEFKDIQKTTSALNDNINPEKRNHLRAAIAEESLISYIINNPDVANTIFKSFSPEKMITGFNKRVIGVLKDIVSEGKTMDISTISQYGFSFEEIGRITRIMCSYKPSSGTLNTIEECLKVIEEENEKIKLKDVSSVSEQDVMEYIKNLKNK